MCASEGGMGYGVWGAFYLPYRPNTHDTVGGRTYIHTCGQADIHTHIPTYRHTHIQAAPGRLAYTHTDRHTSVYTYP